MFSKLFFSSSLRLAFALSLAAHQFWTNSVLSASDFESPPVLQARTLVDPDLLVGASHRVENEVENDGMMNHFQIRSDFGDFEAASEEMLEIRVNEVYALARLEEISRLKVFAGALGRSAKKPVKAVAKIVTDPGGTAKAIPKGLGRMARGLFYKGRKLGHKVKEEVGEARASSKETEETDDQETDGESNDDYSVADELTDESKKAAKSHFGYNSARRELARKLQVDPYTSNATLRNELTRLAKVAFAAGISFNAVTPTLALVSQAQSVSDLVYSIPGHELERLNNKALKKMKVKSAVRLDFFEKGVFTPSLDTELVESLKRLDSASDRHRIIEFALVAESEVDARAVVSMTTILADYHQNEARIRRILLLGSDEGGRLVVGVSRKGKLIVPVAADYLIWIPELEDRGPLYDYRKRELRVAGRISPRAKRELSQRGWHIAAQVLSQR
jgi:hypothetical protein